MKHPLTSNHGPSARTELPQGSLVGGDSRGVSAAIHSGLRARQVLLRQTDAEWRSVRSWAASHDAQVSSLVNAVLRTWWKYKYPIEWVARPVGERE